MHLPRLAVNHSLTVLVSVVILVVFGLITYMELPREAAPDIEIPYITIAVPYLGVSPADIESLITDKIERELKGLENVKELTSNSSEGMSSVMVEFEPNTDIDTALQKVRDKVNLVKPELPPDAEEPIISEINFTDFPIMIVSLSGEQGLIRLKEIAEDLEDQIKMITGVLDVNISGGLEREVQVNVDPAKLSHYNLSLQDVIQCIQTENINIPGGKIDIGEYKYLIRIPGEAETPYEIGDWVIESFGGSNIHIRDVAEVKFGFKERTTIARTEGSESVTLSVTKRSGENLIRISDEIKALLNDLRMQFGDKLRIKIIQDNSKFVRDMVHQLENNIITGLILVVIVLFLFLGFRNAILVGAAIPLCMLITFIVLGIFGITLNMVVLFSLILALGMLVDNSIVLIENTFRHVKGGERREKAAAEAAQEVVKPIAASTLTTICAFAPMLFWPGIMGEFMGYLPKTIIITLLSSLAVAVFINPVFCARFLKVKGQAGEEAIKRYHQHPIIKTYNRFLCWAMVHRVITILIAVAVFILTVMLYFVFNLQRLGVEFFPSVDPEKAFVLIKAPVGTNLETSNELARQIEEDVKEVPDLETYVTNVGSGGGTNVLSAAGGTTTHLARITLDFVDFHERSISTMEHIARLRNQLDYLTGADIEVVREEFGPPTGAPINLEISGPDLGTLNNLAQKARELIKTIPGTANLSDDFESGQPELRILVDRERAMRLGINSSLLASTVRTAVNGTEASNYRVGDEEHDITVRLGEGYRSSVEDISTLEIAAKGKLIPLKNIAEIELAGGPGTIRHIDRRRTITVSADAEEGVNPKMLLGKAREKIRKMELPAGYRMEFTGQNEEEEITKDFLSKAFLVALFLIALVLITEFDSLTKPFIIIFSVVLSLIGVLLGLTIVQIPFGILMTGIGAISLAGVVVNNTIVLIDFIEQLRERGYPKVQAIIEAGTIRLRPVMLTAATTILGLIPLSTGLSFDFQQFKFVIGGENSQWWGPMGVAVIFGLAIATILTLIIVPVMYYYLDRKPDNIPPGEEKTCTTLGVEGIE